MEKRTLKEFTKEEYEEFFCWLFDRDAIELEKEVDISKCLEYQEPYIYYTSEIKSFFETKPMKRLGRIGQLANCSLGNPNASHTRLSHCKGAYQKMLDFYMLQYSKKNWREKNSDEESRLKVLADMMDMASHDIGHNVCSHALENLIGSCKGAHEILGARILHENEEVVQTFNNIHPKLLQSLDIVKKEDYNLHTLKEGNIDFDRADFLIRDSLYLGVENGFQGVVSYPRTITELLDKIMDGCEIYEIEKDGKTLEVPVFSYEVEPEIEEFLERRTQNYENIYCSKTNKPNDVMLLEFSKTLIASEEESELKDFLKHISESEIDNIDLNMFLEWDDIRFFNSLFDIINKSNNSNLKKLAIVCLPKLDALISILYERIMPHITPTLDENGNEVQLENDFQSEEDKKFYLNVKRLVKDKSSYEEFMTNGVSEEEIMSIFFDSSKEQEHFKNQLRTGVFVSSTAQTITFPKEKIEKLDFWDYRIKKYNKTEPIFIRAEDNRIYTLDEYPNRVLDIAPKEQCGVIAIETKLRTDGFDSTDIEKLRLVYSIINRPDSESVLNTECTRLNSELKDIELKIKEADEK